MAEDPPTVDRSIVSPFVEQHEVVTGVLRALEDVVSMQETCADDRKRIMLRMIADLRVMFFLLFYDCYRTTSEPHS